MAGGALADPEVIRMLAPLQTLFLFDALRRLLGTAKSIDALEAKKLIDTTPGIVILDVRKDGEYRGGHLPRAQHAPHGLMRARAKRMDPNATYLLYCKSGARSGKAAAALMKHGFRDVYTLHGGVGAWQRYGFPLAKR